MLQEILLLQNYCVFARKTSVSGTSQSGETKYVQDVAVMRTLAPNFNEDILSNFSRKKDYLIELQHPDSKQGRNQLRMPRNNKEQQHLGRGPEL